MEPRSPFADDLSIATPHAARGRWQLVALRLMSDIRVGDDVIFRGRVFRVRGVSPMSATPRRVLLEDLESGENVEAQRDQVEPVGDDEES
jgi:hypothetical protein